MKKEELKSLGLSDEVIKAVQELHGRDTVNLRKKLQKQKEVEAWEQKRNITADMISVLKDEKNIKRIMCLVAECVKAELEAEEKKSAADAEEQPTATSVYDTPNNAN